MNITRQQADQIIARMTGIEANLQRMNQNLAALNEGITTLNASNKTLEAKLADTNWHLELITGLNTEG